MAGLSSTKKDCTLEEWLEQVDLILELNGYNPAFCDAGPDSYAAACYHQGQSVCDYFYDNFEVEE